MHGQATQAPLQAPLWSWVHTQVPCSTAVRIQSRPWPGSWPCWPSILKASGGTVGAALATGRLLSTCFHAVAAAPSASLPSTRPRDGSIPLWLIYPAPVVLG